jgi:branched-chain amino acid transport system permease protein
VTSFYLNVLVSGLLIGFVYALIALGLTIIFGVMRMVNFAHGEMVVIGMYAAYWMWSATHLPPWLLAIPTGALLFFVGYWLQKLIINAYIDRPQHTQFILFISLALIITGLHVVLFGPDPRSIQDPMTMQSYTLGTLRLDKVRAQAALTALALIAGLIGFLRYSTLGRAIRAAADNLVGAQVIGISVKRVYAMTAGIGMACAGAAGALISPMFDTQPFLATDFTLIAFIIVIVGGLGSLTGALFGGILIGLAEAIAALAFSPSLKTLFSYALLVFVLLLRPNGLFGERERS